MANDNESLREKQKRRLRENMVRNDRVRLNPVSWIESHKKAAAITAAAAIAFILAALCVWVFVVRFWKYTTYEIKWSAGVSNAASADYTAYGDGVVVLNKDGAVYYDSSGSSVWSVPYDMSDPRASVNGDYILVYDQDGKNYCICNKSGKTGSGTASHIIIKGCIAATGVFVLQMEDSNASLINYYRSSGEEIRVSIRNPLQTDGYPLDISLSPGGQQLMVSYYSVADGAGTNRISFYDFEEGKDAADRIVASFDYSESGMYMPKTVYISNSQAFAVGNGCVSIFDVAERTDIAKWDVAVNGQIQRFFYSSDYIGLVTTGNEGYEIHVYSNTGNEVTVIKQQQLHTGYAFQGAGILMYDSDYVEIIAFSGRVRFEANFINDLYAVIPTSKFGGCYLATMEQLQQISLK